ncbi:hypothetical protein LXL04_033305 [Taraxacum kok-saghyz]
MTKKIVGIRKRTTEEGRKLNRSGKRDGRGRRRGTEEEDEEDGGLSRSWRRRRRLGFHGVGTTRIICYIFGFRKEDINICVAELVCEMSSFVRDPGSSPPNCDFQHLGKPLRMLVMMQNMDLMDVNQVLEVPDTPDRLAAATHDSNYNERQINASTNNQKTSKDYTNGRIRNQQQMENGKGKSVIVNGSRRLFINPNSSTSFKHYPRPSVDTTRHDKGKSLCHNSNVQKFTHQEGGVTQNGHEHSGINRVNVNPTRKGVLSLKTCKLNRTSDHGKGVDLHDTAHHKVESNPPGSSSKPPQKKMLVRNGCISPHNIAKSKHVIKIHEENGNMVKQVQSGTTLSEGQSNTIDIKDLVSEPKDSHRYKVSNLNHHLSSKEPERWRTTHNHRKQSDTENMKKDFLESKSVSSSMSHHNTHSNRQKEETGSRNLGKRCVSLVDDSNGETSTSNSNSNSNSRSKRNKTVNGVGPSNHVVEPITCDNEDSSVRDLQVEADERLARELQEQLYNEEMTPVLGFDQMDSHLAYAMPAQHQDNNAPRRRAYRRQAPPPSLNAHNQIQRRAQQPQPRTSRLSNLRASIRPTINSFNRRRNPIFPSNMDLDMRMEILETLEAVGDMTRPNAISRIGRDFNEGDYEMLLALDENNHRHGGATSAQINNLPESRVQAENLQECSICLETPTIGETIRHLPCLHRFHKAVPTFYPFFMSG